MRRSQLECCCWRSMWAAAGTGFFSKVGLKHRVNSTGTISYLLLGYLPALVLAKSCSHRHRGLDGGGRDWLHHWCRVFNERLQDQIPARGLAPDGLAGFSLPFLRHAGCGPSVGQCWVSSRIDQLALPCQSRDAIVWLCQFFGAWLIAKLHQISVFVGVIIKVT